MYLSNKSLDDEYLSRILAIGLTFIFLFACKSSIGLSWASWVVRGGCVLWLLVWMMRVSLVGQCHFWISYWISEEWSETENCTGNVCEQVSFSGSDTVLWGSVVECICILHFVQVFPCVHDSWVNLFKANFPKIWNVLPNRHLINLK